MPIGWPDERPVRLRPDGPHPRDPGDPHSTAAGCGRARLWGGRAVVHLPRAPGGLRDARGRAGRRLRGGPPPAPAPRADHGEPRRDQHDVAQGRSEQRGHRPVRDRAVAGTAHPVARPAVRPPTRTSSGSLWRTGRRWSRFEYTYLVVVLALGCLLLPAYFIGSGRLPELAGGHRFRHDRPAVRRA